MLKINLTAYYVQELHFKKNHSGDLAPSCGNDYSAFCALGQGFIPLKALTMGTLARNWLEVASNLSDPLLILATNP